MKQTKHSSLPGSSKALLAEGTEISLLNYVFSHLRVVSETVLKAGWWQVEHPSLVLMCHFGFNSCSVIFPWHLTGHKMKNFISRSSSS